MSTPGDILTERMARLYELTHLSVTGRATRDQSEELDTLVCGDPALCKTYVRLIQTETLLHGWAEGDAEAPDAAVEESTAGRIGRWRAIAVAAAVLIAAGVIGIVVMTAGPEKIDPTPVATLITVDGDVVQDDRLIVEGEILNTGRIRVTGGVAEILLDSGVRVLTNGQTSVVLRSPMKAAVEHGHVAVHVPQRAAGFHLATPRSEVIDLGTEFGVTVDEAGDESVFVYEGSVRYRSGGNDWRVLGANEGVAVAANGEMRSLDVPPHAGSLSFDSLDALNQASGSGHWLADDEDAIAVYDFERLDPNGRFVNLAAAPSSAPMDLQMLASTPGANEPTLASGRLSDLHAVRLSESTGQVLTAEQWAPRRPLGAMTIVAWVRLEQRAGHQIIAANWNHAERERGGYGFHFHVLDGKLELLLNDPQNVGGYVEFTPDAGQPLVPLNAWVQLACTVEAGGRVRLLVNGEELNLTHNEYDASSIQVAAQPLMIGGLPNYHLFDGAIDELAILGRAMTPQEIQRMFTATRAP